MAGTMLLLVQAGWEAHYLTLSGGDCGSMLFGPAKTRAIRAREARAAAKLLGARFHPSFCNDLEIFYEARNLRRLAAIIRHVQPTVILTHSPEDYMEDHMITARLTVSAAFVRGMPNYRTSPVRPPTRLDTTIYHALPHGLRDGMRRVVEADAYVNTLPVQAAKRAALAAHASQKEWLDATQGMNSYLDAMDAMAFEVGTRSGKFAHAEGWRRHSHLGFCNEAANPLRDVLGPTNHYWEPESTGARNGPSSATASA